MNRLIFLLGLVVSSSALDFGCYIRQTVVDGLGSETVPICIVKNCDVYNGSQKSVKRHNLHGRKPTQNDIKMISFEICEPIDFIPKTLLKDFPKFISLVFHTNRIYDLKGDELSEYIDLVHFQLYGNIVSHVPGNFFSNNKKLKLVSFHSNRIKTIGMGLLDSISKMTHVTFDNNICINMHSFNDPKQLRILVLTLGGNCVKEIG